MTGPLCVCNLYNITLQSLKDMLHGLSKIAHIFYVMSFSGDIRSVIISAQNLGLLDRHYVFLAADAQALLNTEFSYQPEMSPVINHGLLGIKVKGPSGAEYDRFCQKVIDQFDHPQFDGVPHLPATASIDEVDAYAGNRLNLIY